MEILRIMRVAVTFMNDNISTKKIKKKSYGYFQSSSDSTDQSHIQGNDLLSNLYRHTQYILSLHRLFCLRRSPVRYVGDILSITENKGIIHTDDNTQTR